MSGAATQPAGPGEPPVLVADDLHRSFGKVTALRGLSLSVSTGEMVGLVGPDGAGKTTAMRILAGMIAPDRGQAQVVGQNPMSSKPSLRSALGYMPQQYSLYGDLTVEENLRFFSRMFCLPRALYRERRQRLLGITRLARFVDRRADALSGGMYKKLALACSLLPRPKVLLLDEPTNGVDPVSRRELWTLLFELTSDGMAVLISTPYMDEAARCHRVGLVHEGRLLKQGRPSELLARFPHKVFEVEGGDREACLALAEGHPSVLASSAAGERLRVVVAHGAVEAVTAETAALGASLSPVAPDFEDLFLAETAEA